jgi:hypothetical protein
MRDTSNYSQSISTVKIEAQRLQNLGYKVQLLADFSLPRLGAPEAVKSDSDPHRARKKRKLNFEHYPIRTSARIVGTESKPSFREPSDRDPVMREVRRRKSHKEPDATTSLGAVLPLTTSQRSRLAGPAGRQLQCHRREIA